MAITSTVENLDQDVVTETLLTHLWRGGAFGYYWTPDGQIFTGKDGAEHQAKNTYWHTLPTIKPLPSSWDTRNVYFGVHPTSTKQPNHDKEPHKQRSTIAAIAAINCLFAEFDGKSFVEETAIASRLPADFANLDHKTQKEAHDAARLAAYLADTDRYLNAAWLAIGAMPLTPSVIVGSGGGYHVYHLLRDTVTVTDANRWQVSAVQWAWVQLVGSDQGAKDLARILRLPGSQNRKAHHAPTFPTVAVISADFTRLYDFSEFENLTEALRAERTAKVNNIGHRNGTVHSDEFEDAADALRRLATWRADDRSEWIRIGMALKAGLGDAGFDLWEQWSQGSYKYEVNACRAQWHAMHPTAVSIATLYGMAQTDNPKPKQAEVEQYADGFIIECPEPLDFADLPNAKHVTWPYSIQGGRMVYLREDKDGNVNSSPIADFVVTIGEEIVDETGFANLVLTGQGLRRGKFTAEIAGTDFGSDGKLLAVLTAVTGGIDPIYKDMHKHLRPAIGALTEATSRPRRTRYYRTGWKDDTCREFLMPDMDADTLIAMPPQMAYSAPEPDADLAVGLLALRNLIEALDPAVTAPALAALLLPPLLRPAGWGNERVALFIAGRTGSLKTSWTQTAMCLYGHGFSSNDKLLKFGDGATRTAIMSFAAHAHDLPLFIDNYKPNTGNGKNDFINLIHNILEGGDRKRADRAGNLRENRLIRCIPIATGEDVPRDDAASLARILLVSFAWQRGEANDKLTAAQTHSRHLNAVGATWLDWIANAGRTDLRNIAATFPAYRAKWAETLRKIDADSANIARVASNLAVNELTWEIALRHPQLGTVLQPFTAIYRRGLHDIARVMSKSTTEAMEALQWRNALNELLGSGQYVLVERAAESMSTFEKDRRLGWKDSDGIYLLPSITMAAVKKLLGPNTMAISPAALYDQMDQLGWLAKRGQKQTTHAIAVGESRPYVLHLKTDALTVNKLENEEFEESGSSLLREIGL